VNGVVWVSGCGNLVKFHAPLPTKTSRLVIQLSGRFPCYGLGSQVSYKCVCFFFLSFEFGCVTCRRGDVCSVVQLVFVCLFVCLFVFLNPNLYSAAHTTRHRGGREKLSTRYE
jgi:hypothetical protein